jgi:hypothetical protein
MKQKGKFSCAILVGAFFIPGLMFGAGVSAADPNPCSEDIAKYCKDVEQPSWIALSDMRANYLTLAKIMKRRWKSPG